MLTERTINIIWVSEGYGVGVEPEEKIDKVVKYSGEKIIVRR